MEENRYGPFVPTPLEAVLRIRCLMTLHYFTYTPDFRFTGEKHDFWEMAYVDRGEVGVVAENDGYDLRQGEAIFHRPGEYHNIWAKNQYANIVILSFVCEDAAMSFFEKKILTLGEAQRAILAEILRIGEQCFVDPLNFDVNQTALRLRKDAPLGSLQMIGNHLELLLLSLIRQSARGDRHGRTSPTAKFQGEVRIVEAVCRYLEDNLYRPLTFEDVLGEVCFSKSYLTRLFRQQAGQGVMEHYRELKIEEAKRLISRRELSLTEIAERLHFSSIHYFSRIFKRQTGMTPSEYRRSVQSRSVL